MGKNGSFGFQQLIHRVNGLQVFIPGRGQGTVALYCCSKKGIAYRDLRIREESSQAVFFVLRNLIYKAHELWMSMEIFG